MVIFHSYVKLPEGISNRFLPSSPDQMPQALDQEGNDRFGLGPPRVGAAQQPGDFHGCGKNNRQFWTLMSFRCCSFQWLLGLELDFFRKRLTMVCDNRKQKRCNYRWNWAQAAGSQGPFLVNWWVSAIDRRQAFETSKLAHHHGFVGEMIQIYFNHVTSGVEYCKYFSYIQIIDDQD